ncbi:MAG: hypothetical protein IJ301_05040 [Clostridia bacterium]|nr:hypothetical protein [Clostridia bacterium]
MEIIVVDNRPLDEKKKKEKQALERYKFQKGMIDHLEGDEPLDRYLRQKMKYKKMFQEQVEKRDAEEEIKKVIEELIKEIESK